jgi:hypothetical protein
MKRELLSGFPPWEIPRLQPGEDVKDTEYDKVELGSRSDTAKNADGSVDFVFAPEPPKGSPESNWIPTVPGRAWFTYFPLYAPLQPYFDASWKLPDIEAA